MGILKRSNPEDVVRYWHENGEDYLDLRTNISKREATNLFKVRPEEDDIDGGQQFLEVAFAILIQGWSLVEDDGTPVAPNINVYYELDAIGTRWIDESIGKHLPKVFGVNVEELEKKEETSHTPALKAKTSRKA